MAKKKSIELGRSLPMNRVAQLVLVGILISVVSVLNNLVVSSHTSSPDVWKQTLDESSTNENGNYKLDFSTLAHWDQNLAGISGVILVPKSVKAHINGKQGFSDPFGHKSREELPYGACEWCSTENDECNQGMLAVSWNEEWDQDLDVGIKSMISTLRSAVDSAPSHIINRLKTMTFHCTFLNKGGQPGHLKFRLPYDIHSPHQLADYNFTFVLPVQATNEFVSNRYKNRTVVCGRQLFGLVEASYLRDFVKHNRYQGIATTVFYELGNSRIRNRALLEAVIESGDLVIVDLRNIMQDIYGAAAVMIAAEAPNAAQYLTRNDCVHRFRPLNPSWIAFLDMDEYAIPGEKSSDNDTLSQLLSHQTDESLSVQLITETGDGSFCDRRNTFSVERNIKLDRELRLSVNQWGNSSLYSKNTKYAVRPTEDVRFMLIHLPRKKRFRRNQVDIPLDVFYLRHNRCVNTPLNVS